MTRGRYGYKEGRNTISTILKDPLFVPASTQMLDPLSLRSRMVLVSQDSLGSHGNVGRLML